MTVVRTTIELRPEAWHLAKAVARERNQSPGEVVSDFILLRGGSAPLQITHSVAGFPVFSSGKRISSEDVQRLLDEDVETER
jgi:hypothetical protein